MVGVCYIDDTILEWTLNIRKFSFSFPELAGRYHRGPRLTGGEVFIKANESQLAVRVSANTPIAESRTQADEINEGFLAIFRADEVVYENADAFHIKFVVIESRVRLQFSNQSARHRRGSMSNDINFAKLCSSLSNSAFTSDSEVMPPTMARFLVLLLMDLIAKAGSSSREAWRSEKTIPSAPAWAQALTIFLMTH